MNTFNFQVSKELPADQIEAGRKLFTSETNFLKGVVAMNGLPTADRPEVCFAGRSNVGKSSLINGITGRKSLARTSNTPGRTQEINFFSVSDKLYVVDLPGYGYAEAPLSIVEKWQSLLRAYLSGRPTLRRVFVLIDSRHGIKKVDQDIFNLLDKSAVTFQIVLTKVDKIKVEDIQTLIQGISQDLSKHPAAFPEILLTSSNSGEGIKELRAIITSF
jgi:GTP-binding protein